MRFPNMLLFWPLALFFFTGAFANLESGKYEMLLFYRLRQFMIDAVGEEKNTVSKKCPAPCTFEDFIKKNSLVRRGRALRDSNDDLLVGPDGGNVYDPKPNYSGATKWIPFETLDLSDYGAVGSAIDELGFRGQFIDGEPFGLGKPGYDKITQSADKAIEDSRMELQNKGKDPNSEKGLLKEIKDLLKITADARRISGAAMVLRAFKSTFPSVGEPIMTDPIAKSSPPLPTYQQIDIERTIAANPTLSEDDKKEMRGFVKAFNAGKNMSHVKGIRDLDNIYEKVKVPFGQCPK